MSIYGPHDSSNIVLHIHNQLFLVFRQELINYNVTYVLQWTVGNFIFNLSTVYQWSLVKSALQADLLEVCRKSAWGPWWTGWNVGLVSSQRSQTSHERKVCESASLQRRTFGFSPSVFSIPVCRRMMSLIMCLHYMYSTANSPPQVPRSRVIRRLNTDTYCTVYCVVSDNNSKSEAYWDFRMNQFCRVISCHRWDFF